VEKLSRAHYASGLSHNIEKEMAEMCRKWQLSAAGYEQ
jgi:hypothetical protein